jgi:hypothetical protein
MKYGLPVLQTHAAQRGQDVDRKLVIDPNLVEEIASEWIHLAGQCFACSIRQMRES